VFFFLKKTAFSENITYKNDASGNPIKLDLYKPKIRVLQNFLWLSMFTAEHGQKVIK
jgi:hypothetical protein